MAASVLCTSLHVVDSGVVSAFPTQQVLPKKDLVDSNLAPMAGNVVPDPPTISEDKERHDDHQGVTRN